MNFKQIRVTDLLLVNHHGDIVEGNWPVNAAAFCHPLGDPRRPARRRRRRPQPLGVRQGVLGAAPGSLDPITQDACAFYEDHSVFDDYTGVVLDAEEGKRIAHALGENKAAILANHGLLTVGHSVDEAVWWFITMERSCQAQLLAMAAGQLHPIEDETARLTASQVGSHLAGWLSFQPLYDWIVAAQPDLLEE